MNIKLFVMAALLLFVIACNGVSESSADQVSSTENITDEKFKHEDENYFHVPDTINFQGPGKVSGIKQVANPDWDKKIIRTAQLNIEVNKYEDFHRLIREAVKMQAGYIASENQQQDGYKLENVVTIKVPVARFEELMNQLTIHPEIKINKREVSSQDVTAEVVDTKSRIEAKRQVRERYLDLLKQAKNMKEILEVQNEINAIQEEMELASGRVGYLNQSSAYSTIVLTFYQIINPGSTPTAEPSFLIKLKLALDGGWDFIKDIILGLVAIWPLWLLVLTAWMGFRRWKTNASPVKIAEKQTALASSDNLTCSYL